MKTHRLVVAGATALSLFAFANCQAEENKQSAASRQASKARDYGNRQDKEGPPDIAAASSSGGAATRTDGDKMPVLDNPAVDKAAKDTGDNWKKMDKLLDRF